MQRFGQGIQSRIEYSERRHAKDRAVKRLITGAGFLPFPVRKAFDELGNALLGGDLCHKFLSK